MDLVINTPTAPRARTDGYEIRSAAITARDPVHHHHGGRPGRGPGDHRRPARRARGRLAPGAPPHPPGERRRRPRSDQLTRRDRPRAGALRRAAGAPSSAAERHGAYTVLRCADPSGPRPRGGPVLHAQGGRSGGAEGPTSGRTCRARSACCAPRPRTDELHFLIEDVGPGTARLCELGPGDELCWSARWGSASRRRATGRRPLLVGGGVGIAPLAIWQDQLGRTARVVLLGFRDAAHAAGAELLRDARGRHRRRQRRPPRPRHRAAGRRARRGLARRGLRLRPAADARGRPRAVRRARRARPARAGVRDGVRLRRLLRLRGADHATATSGCASTGRSRRGAPSRPR